MSSFHPHVQRAISIVGGQVKLAAAIGCSQSEVWRLANEAKSISINQARKISLATNRQVLIADLMPDAVEAIRSEIEAGTSAEVAA